MSWKFTSLYLDAPLVNGRALDLFEPELPQHDIAVFFVHGGGWNAGTRVHFHPLMQEFSRLGYYSASADYRLANGKITIADQLTDLHHAYDEFVSFLKQRQRPVKIVVHGSSAGAHLAALLALARPGECGEAAEFHGVRAANEWIAPVGAVLACGPATFEPWEDIFPPIWSSMQLAAGCSFENDPEHYRRLSPCHYAVQAPCPVLFAAAGNEHMFPSDQIEALAATIAKHQPLTRFRLYPNCEHGFFYDITRNCQQAMMRDFIAFLNDIANE